MRAAKLCSSSLYAAISGFVLLVFLGWIAGVLAGAAALVCGIVGLARLQRVGMGPRNLDEVSAIERVSVRMAHRGSSQAKLGVGLGVLMLGLAVVLFVMARKEEERAGDAMAQFLAQARERRQAEAEDGERERAAMKAIGLIALEVPLEDVEPPDPLPEGEIAKRLFAWLDEYDGTRTAKELRTADYEPFPTFRRILRDHGWDE